MAEFLTTHATAYQLENIIMGAQQHLTLISPYLQLSNALLERLKDADSRGVKIRVIYRTDKLESGERDKLEQLKNISLFSCEQLHAKCFFNDTSMVITSMNMYEFSEKNNREMGILLKKETDPDAFTKAVKEAKSIVNSSHKDEFKSSDSPNWPPPPKATRQKNIRPANHQSQNQPNESQPTLKNVPLKMRNKTLPPEKAGGYCIRCGHRIPNNTARPFCDECYWEWAEYENPHYAEHYCHICGNSRKTTRDKPVCSYCYKALRR